MNVFIMLFFFVVSIIVIIIAGMHAQSRGARPSTGFALMVVAAMGYVIALPVYTAGWVISQVFF